MTGLKQSGLLFYNNVLSLPLMAAYMLLGTTEFQDALRMPQLQDPQFLASSAALSPCHIPPTPGQLVFIVYATCGVCLIPVFALASPPLH